MNTTNIKIKEYVNGLKKLTKTIDEFHKEFETTEEVLVSSYIEDIEFMLNSALMFFVLAVKDYKLKYAYTIVYAYVLICIKILLSGNKAGINLAMYLP